MKSLHWIIFSLAAWILIAPFLADDILGFVLPTKTITDQNLIHLLRWDDFFLGIAILVLALVVVTLEQATKRTPGLKAMHWMQIILGTWIAIAPFALEMSYEAFTWSHFVTGGFVAVFALLQITYEES